MFNKKLDRRVQKLELMGHYESITPTITIPLKTKIEAKSLAASSGFGHTLYYNIPECIGKTLPLNDAVQLLIDYLGLKYEDGSEVKPKLVK